VQVFHRDFLSRGRATASNENSASLREGAAPLARVGFGKRRFPINGLHARGARLGTS
jgi:hypothetical protein